MGVQATKKEHPGWGKHANEEECTCVHNCKGIIHTRYLQENTLIQDSGGQGIVTYWATTDCPHRRGQVAWCKPGMCPSHKIKLEGEFGWMSCGKSGSEGIRKASHIRSWSCNVVGPSSKWISIARCAWHGTIRRCEDPQ